MDDLMDNLMDDWMDDLMDGPMASMLGLVQIWQYALQLIESMFRATLSRLNPGVHRRDECEKHCFLINSISDFLLQLNVIEPYHESMIISSENIGNMYSFISSLDEITYIREVMDVHFFSKPDLFFMN